MQSAHYSPPWADTYMVGIAGSSGSGKTSFAVKIVSSLDLPWVVILSMDSFYKSLSLQQSEIAFRNEYDFDSPDAIDFDILVDRLRSLKQGKKAEIPTYSFAKHQRQEKTVSIYSPHVLILEGIFALYDPRVLDLLDVKIFTEEDLDVCLGRRILRDVKDRGRDVEGCLKQWFGFVKPNFVRYVEPQKKHADIIVQRGIENKIAMDIVVKHIQRTLVEKSEKHRAELQKLGKVVSEEPLSSNVLLLNQTPQLLGMSTIIQNEDTNREEFVFYFDRLATLLVERAMENFRFNAKAVQTPQGSRYKGLQPAGETSLTDALQVSAVVILRSGTTLETGLKRIIPDCRTGRLLIQSNIRTGEPELHYRKLPEDIASHDGVLLLDPQVSSGGAALMAVKVLVDHGVAEEKIVFVTYTAGKIGVNRMTMVFPGIKVVVGRVVEEFEKRWVEGRYLGC
ncbi:MAG: Uridine kinase [Trichoglossum hirsutum]|nr:MAG: Uridine kinase [Trichoglossum hirsutum]